MDPWQRQVFSIKQGETMQMEAEALHVDGTAIQVPVGAIFEELDRLQGISEVDVS